MKKSLFLFAVLLSIAACKNTPEKNITVIQDIDSSIKPGDNFTKVGGFTPNQRFFISVARIWRVKMKDEFLRLWINKNPHAPFVACK